MKPHLLTSLCIFLALSSLVVAESEWLPEGEWALDWADEFSGEGATEKWHPMLGYTPTDYLNNDGKGLRWNGSSEDSAQMYSMRSGHHWLNGEGQLVIRAVCNKAESNLNGFKVETAYLESIPESWILPGWEIQIFYFLKNPAASFQIFD
jgi:hypothetical protein